MEDIFWERMPVVLCEGEPGQRLGLRQVTDVSGQDGISLEAELLEEGVAELQVTLYPLEIARPEFFPEIRGSVVICGKGIHKVDMPFGQFAFRQMAGAFLKYLDAVSFRLLSGGRVILRSARMDRFGSFDIQVARNSLIGNAGEELAYSVMLHNKSVGTWAVNICQEQYGRECLPVSCPAYCILEGGEKKECVIRITLTEDIPAGGVEKAVFRFIPDGDALQAKKVVLYASNRKKHPYLVLEEEEWEKRRGEILGSESLYQAFRQEYEKAASCWKVPEAAESEGFVYPSYAQNDLFRTTVAWKITGKEEYLQKAMQFFAGFLDEDRGYLHTKTSYFTFIESREEYARGDFKVHRAQSGGWVQEAEFFNRLSMCYDLLYDCFAEDDHRKMEECLLGYMQFAGWRLTDGDGNNFQIAECGAGLLSAMVIQDHQWIHRFLYGYNAYLDLLASVFLDDGMYFEEASSYSRLVGELCFDIVNAAEHFGISLKHKKVQASFDRNILHAPWAMRETWAEDGKPFLGMSFQRFEKFTRTTRCLEDYFDCLARLLTRQGILFSINDSNEQDFKELYKKAYYLYRKPLYHKIASMSGTPELIFVPEEEKAYELGQVTELLEGAGLCVLRDGINQVVLKFGVHGGYHGHFDRLSLASFLTGDLTFHNNEYAWYGYDSFLFKMWVQTSMAHNMTVVDGRMQKPSPCQCISYIPHGKVQPEPGVGNGMPEEEFGAVCAQTTTVWMDPPYGGQTPYPYIFPEEKCRREGRYILQPLQGRRQGDTGEYSETVFQRRLLILFHGYCILWDYLEGKKEHRYDCLYHPSGRLDQEEEREFRHRERFDRDPYGAGQFIMNCFQAQVDGPVCLRFTGAMQMEEGRDILDPVPETAIWRAYPLKGSITIGRYPQKGDSFTEQNRKETEGHLQEPWKKTVSLSARGKSAGFITILEAGKETGRIKKVLCKDFESVVVEENDGKAWEITVKGMDRKEESIFVEVGRCSLF